MYLEKNNIPSFSSPENAVSALDQYYRWNLFRGNKIIAKKAEILSERKKQIAETISKAHSEKRRALLFRESAQIMEKYGIKCSEFWDILPSGNMPKDIKYPVVLKVDSDKILHKSDKQALVLDIKNDAEFESAVKNLQENLKMSYLQLQKFLWSSVAPKGG